MDVKLSCIQYISILWQASVVVETSSLESESKPTPNRVKSETRPERLDNLRLGLKPDLKDIFKNM